MKTAAVVLGMMFLAMVSNAQEVTSDKSYFSDATNFGPKTITMAEMGYIDCLKSDNEGVVESALAHVTMMKLTNGTRGFKDLESAIAKVVKSAPTPELRYKAYLALVAMQHPEIFSRVSPVGYSNADELFVAMASRLWNYTSAR